MIKKVKPRKPTSGAHIPSRETTRQSTNSERPIFTFHTVATPYKISDCQQAHKAAFADWLQEVSQLTWQQINQAPREGWGTEKIPREQFSAPLPVVVTPERNILVMRFGGGARVIGYREDATFHVVWIDPHHRAY